MSEDWQAVAQAISERLVALGLNQRELIARSQVSKATVREIQHNTAQRRRSERTLEALSTALDLHPGHLGAVLSGHRPPQTGEPVVRGDDDISGRLSMIEHQLREIVERLGRLDSLEERIDEFNRNVSAAIDHASSDHNLPRN